MPRIGMSRVHGSAAGVAGAGWFGDGSDGDLVVAAGQTLALDVAEDEGQIVKRYGNLTIEAGGVLKPANRCNGMILLVSGDLVVEGTISVDKCSPHQNNLEELALSCPQVRLCGALKGGKGGDGGMGRSAASGNIPGGKGGEGHALGGGFPGGGSGVTDSSSGFNPVAYPGGSGERPPHGITWPYPSPESAPGMYGSGGAAYNYAGGNGPGGSGAIYYPSGRDAAKGNNGDGHPGGAMWIFVKGKVTIGSTGVLTADGGNGADTTRIFGYPRGANGGGAGGGIIALIFGDSLDMRGSIHANAGRAGAPPTNATQIMQENAGTDGEIGVTLIKNISELIG